MIVVPWPRKNEACMCRCVGIFFLGTTCVGFFHGWSPSKPFQIPPTTDCYQRQSTRASILVHRTYGFRNVSHRYSPSVGMCNQFSNSSAHAESTTCVGFEIADPHPNSHTPKAHITTRLTHSVSVLSGCCCLLVPGWHRLRPLQRRYEHGGAKMRNRLQKATKFRPSTVGFCSISRLVLIPP